MKGEKKPLRLGDRNGLAHRTGLHQGVLRPDLGLALELKPAGISEFQLARIGLKAVLAEQAGFQLHALLHLAQEVTSHHR